MNLSKVDLNLFIVFDAIYTEANLTRAGQIVGITQPAVSNALSRLLKLTDKPSHPICVNIASGLSLQIRQVLDIRDHGQAPCDHVRDLLDARLTDIDLKLRQLHDLRDTLAGLRDQAEHVEPDTCSSDQVCRYL